MAATPDQNASSAEILEAILDSMETEMKNKHERAAEKMIAVIEGFLQTAQIDSKISKEVSDRLIPTLQEITVQLTRIVISPVMPYEMKCRAIVNFTTVLMEAAFQGGMEMTD